MNSQILQQSGNITLLGGGPVNHTILSQCLMIAPDLVAADGAADQALALGLTPKLVIGDLDSLSDKARDVLGPERIHETPNQNRTDFDKALEYLKAPLVIGVGFMGGRLDHELACYNALVRNSRRCVLVGEEDLCFHVPDNLTLDLPIGTRISLFPMTELTGHCTGLKWPVHGLEMAPWARVGTSNAVAEAQVTLGFDRPGMLVILPKEHLPEVARALTA